MGRGPRPEIHTKRYKDIYAMSGHLGVDPSDFQEEDTGSQGHFDNKGFEEAVMNAAANNYDYRRATEAATLAGKKDVPTSFDSVDGTRDIYNWMKDQHDGGGKFSSAQDYANITNRLVKEDRAGITDRIDELSTQMLEQAKEKKEAKTTNKGPVEMSDRLKDARNVDGAETDQEAATQAFTDDYKLNLAGGLNLQPTQKRNIDNAMQTTNVDGR